MSRSGRQVVRFGTGHLLATGVTVVAWLVTGDPVVAVDRREPERSLAVIDDELALATQDLVRRCRQADGAELEPLITAWELPTAEGQQFAFRIPATVEQPSCIDTDQERSIWNDFLAARRARAAAVFAHAVWAAGSHGRLPGRGADRQSGAPASVPLPQQSSEAIRLVFLALRDDPDHARARAAIGWVRRGDRWEWPAAARRLDRGEAYDPSFGWMPKSRLARYQEGERLVGGRWVRGDDDEPPEDIRHGRQFNSDHWEIVSTAGEEATGHLALTLEATRLVWLQIYGGFALEPADLERRLGGRGRLLPQTPHSAILCGSRDQYVKELRQLEPRIDVSDGIYWQPTRTIWCFAAPEISGIATVRHEATHQLFAESRPDVMRMRGVSGSRSGFWAVEAAAVYAESIAETPFGWTLGGRDQGRGPAARQLIEEGFFIPLAELASLGREDFQADERLAQLYDQSGGLADFFMNASNCRYREPFLEYLVRIYSGTADPDTLFRLCGRSAPELDTEYREFITAAPRDE